MGDDRCFGVSGVLDSSGIKFTYTVEPQKQRAGILSSGYSVHSGMIIPPGRNDYTITSLCPGECTQRVGIYHAHCNMGIIHNNDFSTSVLST